MVNVLSSKTCCMLFERLNTLAYGTFRVMLAGVGIGLFLPFPDCVGGFLDGWE